ncbi:MAG: hypothetical protein FJ399_00630 [Verrucomicrobia bacterium]|nr:hypothetical protein [Verrucomicrobiota bacterium]
MSFKIIIQASGLNISANLKDEALVAAIQLVQQHRDDSIPTIPIPTTASLSGPAGNSDTMAGPVTEEEIKTTLRNRGGAELLNQLGCDSFPEKILLLGAWHEARGGTTPWRSADMDEIFKLAKESPPANFPRDIKNAIKSGWIHNETPRTYVVTRTGMQKIGQALRSLPS